jgi:hypothetical protein
MENHHFQYVKLPEANNHHFQWVNPLFLWPFHRSENRSTFKAHFFCASTDVYQSPPAICTLGALQVRWYSYVGIYTDNIYIYYTILIIYYKYIYITTYYICLWGRDWKFRSGVICSSSNSPILGFLAPTLAPTALATWIQRWCGWNAVSFVYPLVDSHITTMWGPPVIIVGLDSPQ